jgi:hypothetical protein
MSACYHWLLASNTAKKLSRVASIYRENNPWMVYIAQRVKATRTVPLGFQNSLIIHPKITNSLPKFIFEAKKRRFAIKNASKSDIEAFAPTSKTRYRRKCRYGFTKTMRGCLRMENIKSGSIECFEMYSQFESLQEFNHHIEQWLLETKHTFSKGELVGFKRLVRFSAKIPGVSNAKIGTLLKAIHEEYHNHGISRSTFKRMIQKAIKLGIFTVHETERKNGSQSSNLYVFNRFPSNEPPKQQPSNHPNETSSLSKTINKENKERKEERPNSKNLDHTFTSERVPQPFTQLVQYFFPEAKTIEEYWRMTQICAYQNNREKESETILDTATHAFKQMMGKLKTTTSIKKPIAYYYGILKKKFADLYCKDIDEMNDGIDTYDNTYKKNGPLMTMENFLNTF